MIGRNHTCTNWCVVRAHLYFFAYMLVSIVLYSTWVKDFPNDIWRLVLGLIIVLSPVIVFPLGGIYAARLSRFLLNQREARPFEEWYQTFYSASPDLPPNLVKEILETFASVSGVETTKLRPKDRLIFELGAPHFFWDDSIELYAEALEQCIKRRALDRFRFNNPVYDPTQKTLDDVIRATIAQLLQYEHNYFT